jgi:hypothetical protein
LYRSLSHELEERSDLDDAAPERVGSSSDSSGQVMRENAVP